jgi:myo-inositol 2-dehydrogenase/D-chiro-inositol 1-dehydrogenase
MTLRVGVIGVGMIGQDHIRRITQVLSGGAVTGVSDMDRGRAQSVADTLPGATVFAQGEDLIRSDDVDAVLVTSSGPTHERYVLDAISQGKPVFCEKPLATTAEACARIVDAEAAVGSRLVQVGFMRRYDQSYRALKRAIEEAVIGAPLVIHCAHRNPSVPDSYVTEMALVDTAVHEIDSVRWLLGEEIVATRVFKPRRSRNASAHLQDPLILIMETASGVIVDVEISVNIAYGYDIRCEVVGESGTAALSEAAGVTYRRAGTWGGHVPGTWIDRFVRAYDTEIQEWINDVVRGVGVSGPTAWDGYAAIAVCSSAVQALVSGERVGVSLPPQPELYRLGRGREK